MFTFNLIIMYPNKLAILVFFVFLLFIFIYFVLSYNISTFYCISIFWKNAGDRGGSNPLIIEEIHRPPRPNIYNCFAVCYHKLEMFRGLNSSPNKELSDGILDILPYLGLFDKINIGNSQQ